LRRRVTVEFDEFGWGRLKDEADRQHVPVEELVLHAVAYFLADVDSGRAAHRVMKALSDDDPSPQR
jgi:hypothetical protein